LGRHFRGDCLSAKSRRIVAQGFIPHDRDRGRRRSDVILTACFPQDRTAFLVGLAVSGAVCCITATLLRNVASCVAALAGITAVIVAGDELGATGGVSDGGLHFGRNARFREQLTDYEVARMSAKRKSTSIRIRIIMERHAATLPAF
jgi:hypothetical protein